MLNISDPQTFWLNATNIALGLVCLACLALVGGAVVREVMARAKARQHAPESDPHTFAVPQLGTTMADGGDPVEKQDD